MTTMPASRKRQQGPSLLAPLVALMLPVLTMTAPARADQPAHFMQRVANELVAASRSGSQSAFADVIRRHGDLPTIGLYSLGSYGKGLPQTQRSSFYTGMINFIARYAATESPKYPVADVIVIGQTEETKSGVYVDSTVKLKNGTNYEVRWWLVRRGGSFKVGDAEVIGFSAREQLKRLFENYIAENGGQPQALVVALSRF